jgi:hypothetical protein
VAVSPDGKTLATGAGDHTKQVQAELFLWDLETKTLRQKLSASARTIWSLAFSPDGNLLAGMNGTAEMIVWDVKAGQVRKTLPVPNGRPLAFSPDGRLLAAGYGMKSKNYGEGGVRLWDTATWQERFFGQSHQDLVFSIGFSPDSRTLVSTAQDGTMSLWPLPLANDRLVFSASEAAPGQSAPPPPKVAAPANAPPPWPQLPGNVRLQEAQAAQAAAQLQQALVARAQAARSLPPAAGKDWLSTAELLGMFLTLAAMGGWFYFRERREPNLTAAAVARKPEAVASAPITVPCQDCGRVIKARAALAGKKVKCPQCGKTVAIPARF